MKQALPEVFDEGSNLMLEALCVSEGFPLEDTGYASFSQATKILRAEKREALAAEEGDEDSGSLEAWFKQRAIVQGEIAKHEVRIAALKARATGPRAGK